MSAVTDNDIVLYNIILRSEESFADRITESIQVGIYNVVGAGESISWTDLMC